MKAPPRANQTSLDFRRVMTHHESILQSRFSIARIVPVMRGSFRRQEAGSWRSAIGCRPAI